MDLNKNQPAELTSFAVPMKSQFRLLEFYGAANGNFLNQFFNPQSLIGRKLTVKAIKVMAYYLGAAVDFNLFDGVTNSVENLVLDTRINRVFDNYSFPCNMELNINGAANEFFQAPFPAIVAGQSNSWIDLDIDNINYQYPEKIESLNFSVNASIIHNCLTGAISIPNVRVFVQCYLT